MDQCTTCHAERECNFLVSPPGTLHSMNKDMQVLEKKINKIVAYWIPRFGLSDWTIEVRFEPEKTYDVDIANTDYQSCTGIASIADWQYKQASLICYGRSLISLADVVVEDIVIHDLYHIIEAELTQSKNASDAQAHEERVTTNLQQIIRRQIGRECVALKGKEK